MTPKTLKLTPKMIRDVYATREKHLLAVTCLDLLAAAKNPYHSPIKGCVYEMAIPAENGISELLTIFEQHQETQRN
ncbi:hypothetical protein L596_018028 [Steinernema carpocapsae]|uniref:Uncharacterized protein n=1 Tax=Steinernema carpocapsae TaxID=34508 RepID=A0A4U5N466_STECR|nr:hypothetical protein L596_018028 [Steinernema carpocapsae]